MESYNGSHGNQGHYHSRSHHHQCTPVYYDDGEYVYTKEYRPQTSWSHDGFYNNRAVYHSNPSISSNQRSYDNLGFKPYARGNKAWTYYEYSPHAPAYSYAEDGYDYQEDQPAANDTGRPPQLQTTTSRYLTVPRHQVTTSSNGYLAVPQGGHYWESPAGAGRRHSKDSMLSYRSSQRSVSAFSNVSAVSAMCLRGVCTLRRPSYDWCELVNQL